jgi:hypothetical protein
MGEKALIAVVSAAAALGGAAIGAVATYFSTQAGVEGNQRVAKEQIAANQKVVQSQIDREDRRQLKAAHGVALTYSEQLGRAQRILEYAQQIRQWPGRNNLSDVALPALEDRRLILSRLSARSASTVIAADGAMRTVTSIIEVRAGHPLSPKNEKQIAGLERQLHAGVNALSTIE